MPLRVSLKNCAPEVTLATALDQAPPSQGSPSLEADLILANDFFISAAKGLALPPKKTFPNLKNFRCRPDDSGSSFYKLLGITAGSGLGILGMAHSWGDQAIAERMANAIISTRNNADRAALLDSLFVMLENNPDIVPILENLARMPALSELNIHEKLIDYQIRSLGARSPLEPGDILRLAALAQDSKRSTAREILQAADLTAYAAKLDPQDPEFVLKVRAFSAAAEHKNPQAIELLGRLNLADIQIANYATPVEKLSLLARVAINNGPNGHRAFLILQNTEVKDLFDSLEAITEILPPMMKTGNPSALEYAHRCTPELLEELAEKSAGNSGNERRHALIAAIDSLYPFTGNLSFLQLLKKHSAEGNEYAQRLFTQIQSDGKSLVQLKDEAELKAFLEQMPEFRELVEHLNQPGDRFFKYFDIATQGHEEILEGYRWIPRDLRAEYLRKGTGEAMAPGMIPIAYIRAFLTNHRGALRRITEQAEMQVFEVENAGITMLLEKNPEFSQLSPKEQAEIVRQLRADWDMLPLGEKSAFQDIDRSNGISPTFISRWIENRGRSGGEVPTSGIREEDADTNKGSKKGPKGGP